MVGRSQLSVTRGYGERQWDRIVYEASSLITIQYREADDSMTRTSSPLLGGDWDSIACFEVAGSGINDERGAA